MKRYQKRGSTHCKPSHLHCVYTVPSVSNWIELLNSTQVMYAVISTQTIYATVRHSDAKVTSSNTHWGHVAPFIGQCVVPSST